MKLDYRIVDTSTPEGILLAERLHANGWRIMRTGLFLIWFERKRGKA